jgi:hypothetical protein
VRRRFLPSGRSTGRGLALDEARGTANRRADAKRHDHHKPEPTQPAVPTVASGRVIQLALDRDELLGLTQDPLESLALRPGMLATSSLLEDVVTRPCGRRYERERHRTHTRYGHQRGMAILAGQKIAIPRPRVRRTGGSGEVPLETYARLRSPEAMPEAVLRRVIRGVSTRDYENVIDLTRDAPESRNRVSAATSSGPPQRKSRPWRYAVSTASTSRCSWSIASSTRARR